MGLDIKPLGPLMAAEATGIDLDAGITAAERDALRQAVTDHLVLCIRGQRLAPERMELVHGDDVVVEQGADALDAPTDAVGDVVEVDQRMPFVSPPSDARRPRRVPDIAHRSLAEAHPLSPHMVKPRRTFVIT